jgi:hypothetical protein
MSWSKCAQRLCKLGASQHLLSRLICTYIVEGKLLDWTVEVRF